MRRQAPVELGAAGGNLLDRRALLRAGMTSAGASLLAVMHRGVAGAQETTPDWMRVAGAPVRSYGMPSPFEADVERYLVPLGGDLAPGFSASGTPLEKLRGTITPNGLHYELHHSGVPEIDPDRHVLMIHGRVRNPIRFKFAALDRYPMVTRTHFLECAGNSGFNAISPDPLSHPAGLLHGLVSGAQWTGIPVRLLLKEAGIEPEGRWVVAVGADAANLSRSIPVEKLLDDALIALYQNGERLRPEQGYPMRLFLPGWEGNMSVKWLTSLWVTDRPAHTKDEVGEYTDLLVDGTVLQFTFPMGVKSIITHPSGEMTMSGPGLYEISGLAWSGLGRITRVEVSADGGRSWANAELEAPVEVKALTRFAIPWEWDGSPTTLMSRAHDDRSYVQPTRGAWKARYDAQSYNHYNAIQAWRITSEGSVHNVYA